MISEEKLAALRSALQHRLHGAVDDSEVRQVLRDISHEARTEAIPAEQVIIALKRIWESLPEVQRASGRQEQLRLLDRIVTLCIEEYYADSD